MSSSQATFSSTLADVQSSIAGSSFTYHKDLKTQTESLGTACDDGEYPFVLEWPSIDPDKRSRQTTIVRAECEGYCYKRVGIRSPNRFHCSPRRSCLYVQECTNDLSSNIQRGNAGSLRHSSGADLETDRGALFRNSRLSFRHRCTDIHTSSGHGVFG